MFFLFRHHIQTHHHRKNPEKKSSGKKTLSSTLTYFQKMNIVPKKPSM